MSELRRKILSLKSSYERQWRQEELRRSYAKSSVYGDVITDLDRILNNTPEEEEDKGSK